ncbi:dihydrodipicolinate synthase family protein [Acidobacteria bacterium AH-259-O06]|nr:dihydrodipicolinate synthase family protein [Acidobacteria bacterium AH-259-O06]
MPRALRGVITVLCTPLKRDGSLDLDAFRKLVRFQLHCRVHGIATLGLASESYKLTFRERVQLAQTLVEEVNGEVPLVVGTGGESGTIAVEQTRAVEAAGMDAVLVTPPLITKMREADIFSYYAQLVEKVTIPIMVQDASGLAGPLMSIDLLVRMHKELGIEYVKIEAIPAGPKIAEVIFRTGGRLKVFSGYGGLYLYDVLERGIMGFMPGCDLPEIYVQIWNLYQAGEKGLAWDLFRQVLPLIVLETQNIDIYVSITKKVLHHRGLLPNPAMRPPGVGEADPFLDKKIRAFLQEIGPSLESNEKSS